MSMQILDESSLYSNFINSLKSEYTKRNYAYCLKQYMKFHNFTEYSSLMITDKEEKIKQFVVHLRIKEASKSRFKILFATLKNFYEMNDVEDIKWRKLKRFIGEEIPEHEDRCYAHEEIHTLVKNASLKLKSAILLMASSGVRIGAIPSMTVCHLEKRGDLYKINVYKGQKGKGQYYTFCTPECARAIDSYLELRKRCGEKITPTSPLFRKDFDTDFHEQARNAIHPWSRESIIMALRKLSILNGLLVVDHVNPSGNRKEVKLSHGFRKFFVTMLVNSKISETIISKLTGHTIPNSMGLLQIYSKQTESEMLDEYMKAVDNLTINPENRLKRKVTELTEQQDEITLMKLSHEKEMKEMRGQMNKIVSLIQENPRLAKVKKEVLSEI